MVIDDKHAHHACPSTDEAKKTFLSIEP